MKSFFHKFIDFRGRMGRRDYVEHFLFLFIIGLINVGANLVLHSTAIYVGIRVLSIIICLMLVAQRIRDINDKALWIFAIFAPAMVDKGPTYLGMVITLLLKSNNVFIPLLFHFGVNGFMLVGIIFVYSLAFHLVMAFVPANPNRVIYKTSKYDWKKAGEDFVLWLEEEKNLLKSFFLQPISKEAVLAMLLIGVSPIVLPLLSSEICKLVTQFNLDKMTGIDYRYIFYACLVPMYLTVFLLCLKLAGNTSRNLVGLLGFCLSLIFVAIFPLLQPVQVIRVNTFFLLAWIIYVVLFSLAALVSALVTIVNKIKKAKS